MKFKITRRNLKEQSEKIIAVGYCNAQTLLRFESEESYCAGVYG